MAILGVELLQLTEVAKYNIYKVREGQTSALRSHLVDDKKYILTDTFLSENFVVTVYISEKDSSDIWWLKQYHLHLTGHTQKKNEVYSGVVIAVENITTNTYVIPLGKTHFFIQSYIYYTFGLELAEKIADKDQAKMKGLKQFGVKTSKSLTSYNAGSSLVFSSGESAEYLKLKAEDQTTWGDSFLHFGTSVQINNSEFEPTSLGNLLRNVENAMARENLIDLPLMKEVKDDALAIALYKTLGEKILSLDQTISILDYEIYGTEFIFSQQTHIKLKYEEVYSEELTQLTVQDIFDFVTAYDIDVKTSLRKIKVQFLVEGNSKFTISLIQYIEFCNDDIYLYRGRWFYFNQSFIVCLHAALSTLPVMKFEYDFSEAEFITWRDANQEKIKYRERFIVEKLHAELGYSILDRELDTIISANGKKYALEIADLYDAASREMYVIKIGDLSDFTYAFDQAFAMLNNIVNKVYTDVAGMKYNVDSLSVLAIFQTDRALTSATDTKSLIFEIKLNELQKLAQEKLIVLKLVYTSIL